MSASQEPPQSAVERYGLSARKLRPDDARTDYKAFSGDRAEKGELEALEIRLLDWQGEVIFYNTLTRFHHSADKSITLKGMDFFVHIEGENLERLIHLLKRRECDFIQVFDPRRFHDPRDSDAPRISSIEVRELFSGNVSYGSTA